MGIMRGVGNWREGVEIASKSSGVGVGVGGSLEIGRSIRSMSP